MSDKTHSFAKDAGHLIRGIIGTNTPQITSVSRNGELDIRISEIPESDFVRIKRDLAELPHESLQYGADEEKKPYVTINFPDNKDTIGQLREVLADNIAHKIREVVEASTQGIDDPNKRIARDAVAKAKINLGIANPRVASY